MVDIPVDIRLTSLVKMLSEGYTQGHIARELKLSRQAVSKAIKRMKAQGLITEAPESSYHLKFYHVNQLLIHHDKPQRATKNYDLHASEASYLITSKGNLPDGDVNMSNWSYWSAKFGDFSVKAHYGKDSKLIIYPPITSGDTRSEVMIRLGSNLTEIVNLVERMFKCEVDRDSLKIMRRPEIHPNHDPLGKRFEAERVDAQGMNISLNQSGDAHFDINGLDAFERYDRMITDFPKVSGLMNAFTEQLALHLSVLTDMKDTLKLIAEKNTHMERKRHILTHRRGD